MEQTVYLDLLFLINFSMDFLTFYLSSKILSLPLSVGRGVIASVIGGIYADASLFLPFGSLVSLACDLIACTIMCTVAYAKRGRWSEVPFFTIVYFAVSMALGGFMTAVFNLLNKSGLPSLLSGESEGDGISVWLFALLALISALLTLAGGKFFRRRSTVRMAQIEITYEEKTKKLTAFVDSGNLLRDPISAKPCIVVNTSSLSDVLPDELTRLAATSHLASALISDLPETSARRLRLIPSKTANAEGLLLGVLADSVRVSPSEQNSYEVEAIVVLSSLGRSAQGADALLPTELLL